jgi:hypothetical protein
MAVTIQLFAQLFALRDDEVKEVLKIKTYLALAWETVSV